MNSSLTIDGPRPEGSHTARSWRGERLVPDPDRYQRALGGVLWVLLLAVLVWLGTS